jgi:HPt (histidine-containing phosphotransfer) domain-containing protein
MDPIGKASMTDALDQMWAKFLPQLEERVAVLGRAAEALAAGTLSLDMRAEANAAAHKLAGVLGTFGLTKGTILAREAEIIYSGEPEPDPDAATRLGQIAAELQTLVQNRE